MKYLSWILTLPVMIVAVVFAIANRAAATLNLWPFGITVEAPLFVLVLGSGLAGIVVGGAIAWISAAKLRQRARKAQYRAAEAERELQVLQRDLERASSLARPGTPPNLPANDSATYPARPNKLPAGRR